MPASSLELARCSKTVTWFQAVGLAADRDNFRVASFGGAKTSAETRLILWLQLSLEPEGGSWLRQLLGCELSGHRLEAIIFFWSRKPGFVMFLLVGATFFGAVR